MLKLEIDTDIPLAWATILLFIVIIAYMFWDIHYFFRMFFTICWAKLFQSRLKIHETGKIYGFCFTNDADLFLIHMNNARYIRELDFARLNFCERTGLRPSISKVINGTVLQSVNFIRHHENIPLLTFYKITTKLVYWDEKVLYLEHQFISLDEEHIFATVLSKLNVIGLDIHKVICNLSCRNLSDKPPKLPAIENFCECIITSSSKLRKEELSK